MNGVKRLITAESVTAGHPDKMCDVIADAILDAYLALDPHARVSCEVAVTADLILITGEITTDVYVDITRIVRDTVREIGYTRTFFFDPDSVSILISVNKQSMDIARGVDFAFERKNGRKDEHLDLGAGDQGIVYGFACDETPELMPLPISLAHKLAHRLHQARANEEVPYIGPDGKTQVTIEYYDGHPVRIDTVVISTQHMDHVSIDQLREDIWRYVVSPVLPKNLVVDDTTRYLVNPTGRFVLGGPLADKGLKGRKIVVDTYGGAARHGGGAFSGKDATKVDRSAAYAARYIAKNIVAAGLAKRCEVQIGYVIGMAEPVSVDVDTFGTGKIPDDSLREVVKKCFDLRPQGFIKMLNLNRPIYKQTAAYGHFGRSDVDLPWEHTDRVDLLLKTVLSGSHKYA